MYKEIDEKKRQSYMEKVHIVCKEFLVYIDETGIDKYLYREYARALRGQKIIEKISGRKYQRTNLVSGICNGKWIAPMQYEGTTNSTVFESWFKNCLLPETPKGSTIILDNAKFHRKSILPELAKHCGCSVLFLPPYSPDLNPIEKKWAWLKRKLREILSDSVSLGDAIQTIFQLN